MTFLAFSLSQIWNNYSDSETIQ